MELLAHRFRNVGVLALVIVIQVLLLGYQVRTKQQVRLIRVWAVTAVTPVAGMLESGRDEVSSLLAKYVFLSGVQKENERLEAELGSLKQEARYLRDELALAKRAGRLQAFREKNPSQVIAARIIGVGTDSSSKVVFVDRGAGDGVMRGMAVITPDGVVGRVQATYSSTSQVVLVTDPGFAAGVISDRHHVQGTWKGRGASLCRVDYVQNDEDVEVGEWFHTSGDDRVFPRGIPVGPVVSVANGSVLKEIVVRPYGLKDGLDEVLVVIEGVHQQIEEAAAADSVADLLPPPPAETTPEEVTGDDEEPQLRLGTEADRLLDRYRRIGEAQGHRFGFGEPGSAPPDFNLNITETTAPRPASGSETLRPGSGADRATESTPQPE